MAELRAGVQQALAGRSQLFLLTGEPGIGKTRTAAEIAADGKTRGMRVVWGVCFDGAGVPAYWPLIQAARALTNNLGSAQLTKLLGSSARELGRLIRDPGREVEPQVTDGGFDPEQSRFRMFDSFASLLANFAAFQPLMVVLDDLQYADETSWMTLRFIAREMRDAPLMIVASYRDEETRGSEARVSAIADLYRTGSRIALAGLSESEVGQVVASSAGQPPNRKFVSTLYRATGGNPFFVTEVVRAMISKNALHEADGGGRSIDFIMPESVRASIRARLSVLPERAKQLLSAAAVLGDRFEATSLHRLCGIPVDEMLRLLDTAISKGLVATAPESDQPYRFSHALIREALYHDLGNSERVRLHRRTVAILEDLYRTEPAIHLDELAYHSVKAAAGGDAEKAIDYALRAGEAAHAAFAYEQAAHHWRAALEIMERQAPAPERLARLLEKLGDALAITEFEHGQGIDCLERAAKIYEAAGSTVEEAQVRARLGVVLSRRAPTMNVPRAMEQYRRAEEVLGRLPESESQVWLYTGLAQAAMQALHTAEGLNASRRAMEVASNLGKEGPWVRAAALHSDQLFNCGKLSQAAALVDDAWHRADRLDDLNGAFEAAWSGGYQPLALWDPRGAQKWFERELSRPRLKEAVYQRRILSQQLAFARVFRGDVAGARDLLAQAPRAVIEGFMLLCEGEWERARALLDEACDVMRALGSRDGETVHSYFHALVCKACGDLAGAEASIARTLQNSIDGPVIPFQLNASAEACLIAIGQGQVEPARAHLARCREIIASGEDFRGLLGRAALAEGAVAAAGNDHETAQLHFARAIENFNRYDLPWERGQAHLLMGQALNAAGDGRGALQSFDAAQEIYERHDAGAAWFRLLDDARGRPARKARSTPYEGVFRNEGDYWTLSLGDGALHLRTSKGLHYIAQLLGSPGKSIAAVELERIARLPTGRRAASVRRRPRGSEGDERSRVVVTKAIKAAIERIRAGNASLGRYFATSIRTGYSCTYEPDPDNPVSWRVSTRLGKPLSKPL